MARPESALSGETAAIPTNLPARYEIRRLTSEHIPWALAMVCHSNVFCSPVWSVCYPQNQTQRCYDAFEGGTYLVQHQIESGHSFGIFDTQYEYRRPGSAAALGKLYWDTSDASATAEQLLEQMDFPLVTVALSYDAHDPLDMDRLGPLMKAIPLFGTLYHALSESDKRDPETWKAKGHGEVLMRNATSTRQDYEGKGMMKRMAQWLMRYAALKGFRGINIETLHDAVSHVWKNPPAPYRSEVVGVVDLAAYEEKDDEGNMVKPFAPADIVAHKIFVVLSS